MKIYYLSKGHFTNEYYLDNGAFGSRRDVLGKDEDCLISQLKNKVNKKRNSVFYILKEDISKENIKRMQKFFSDSKIRVRLESLVNVTN